jgi:polyisoprenoid-binding protein YceI
MKAITTMFTLLCLYQVSAHAMLLKATAGEVKFTAIGKPGFLKIRGESVGKKPDGHIEFNNDSLTGEFTFDLKYLNTGIDLRDEHMKEKYLEVAKFPTAKLVIKAIPIKAEDLDKNIRKDFSGSLTLHGTTKEISGTADYNGSAKKINAQFKVELSDFGIAIPEHLGIKVSKTAEVEVSVVLAQSENLNTKNNK